jgi:tetratricopeptide (TPR) repeat protein
MVIDAPLSYNAHFGYAGVLDQLGMRAEAETEYRRAIELFPKAPRPYQGLGDLYRRNDLCRPAIEAYDTGLAQSSSSDFDDIRRSLIACLLFVGEYRRAGAEARIGIAGGRDDVSFQRFRHTADSALAVNAPPGQVRITME